MPSRYFFIYRHTTLYFHYLSTYCFIYIFPLFSPIRKYCSRIAQRIRLKKSTSIVIALYIGALDNFGLNYCLPIYVSMRANNSVFRSLLSSYYSVRNLCSFPFSYNYHQLFISAFDSKVPKRNIINEDMNMAELRNSTKEVIIANF